MSSQSKVGEGSGTAGKITGLKRGSVAMTEKTTTIKNIILKKPPAKYLIAL